MVGGSEGDDGNEIGLWIRDRVSFSALVGQRERERKREEKASLTDSVDLWQRWWRSGEAKAWTCSTIRPAKVGLSFSLSSFLFFHFIGNQTKTEKELRNDFAWVWGWGLCNLWFFFFFLWCFYAKFYGFMNLVSGFINFICWRFRCWLKDEKIWVWVVILYIWVLWFEKI